MAHAKRLTLIIAADIFGLTPELIQLAQTLGADTTLVSPHPCTTAFRTEAEGYAAFMARGGVEAYAKRIGTALAARRSVFDLALGFSAGASALWLCLADADLDPWLPKRAEFYYGSRIRDHAHLEPRRHVRLIFAEQEASFDPAALVRLLCARGQNAEVLPGSAHGFMNPPLSGL
jgi:dienelactone hydrolase